MRKMLIVFFIFFPIIIMNAVCHGSEFHPLGFESVSMGGAGVASAKGGYAAYYNPALLSRYKHKMEIALSGGVGYREINIVDSIDTLSDIAVVETLEAVSNLDYTVIGGDVDVTDIGNNIAEFQRLQTDLGVILNELGKLSEKNGLQIMPSASIGAQFGNIGIGVYGMSEATAYATIDADRLDIILPIDTNSDGNDDTYIKVNTAGSMPVELSSEAAYNASSLEAAVNEETTYLNLTGVAWVEIPIAYGHSFAFSWGDLSLGGAVKIMRGQTYDQVISIDTESGDIEDHLEDAAKTDTTWGVDMGLLFSPAPLKNLTAGLVLKNANTPSFETDLGNTLDIDPQLRAGFAYDFPKQNVTCALDIDLTTNETFIENYDAQYIGGGVNFHPFSWFSLRGGLMQNIQESEEEGLVLTAGVGMGVKWLQVDVAGQYSLETGEFDGEEIPRYGRIQVAVVSKWF